MLSRGVHFRCPESGLSYCCCLEGSSSFDDVQTGKLHCDSWHNLPPSVTYELLKPLFPLSYGLARRRPNKLLSTTQPKILTKTDEETFEPEAKRVKASNDEVTVKIGEETRVAKDDTVKIRSLDDVVRVCCEDDESQLAHLPSLTMKAKLTIIGRQIDKERQALLDAIKTMSSVRPCHHCNERIGESHYGGFCGVCIGVSDSSTANCFDENAEREKNHPISGDETFQSDCDNLDDDSVNDETDSVDADGEPELFCHMKRCKRDKYDSTGMLVCNKCGRGFHAKCCDPPLRYELVIRFPWSCNDDKVCIVCRTNDDEAAMLICDGCDRAFHKWCLTPGLAIIPPGDWFCRDCGVCGTCFEGLTKIESHDVWCLGEDKRRMCRKCKSRLEGTETENVSK